MTAGNDTYPPDVEAIRRRWRTYYDRSAKDYTDEGCRILADHAFRDIPALLIEIERLERAVQGYYENATKGLFS